MQKQTCKKCGKTWLIERFDDHLCTELPKTPRAKRAKSSAAEAPKPITTGPAVKGPPIVSIRRVN